MWKEKEWAEKLITVGFRFSGCEGGQQVGMVAKSLWYFVIKEHFSNVAWKGKEETEREWGCGQFFCKPSPANRFVVGTVSGNCTSVGVPGGGHILRCALIRWSGTMSQKKQLPERGVVFAHVLTSAPMLNQQQDSRLSGREVLVQAGGLCTINVVPHTKILCWGEKNLIPQPS